MNLQQLLHQGMGERGMTSYGQFARACGLPTSTITSLFRDPGKKRPRDATLEALAKGLQYPISIVKQAALVSAGLVQDKPLEEDIAHVVEMMREAPGPVRVEIREVVDTILRAARRREEEGAQDDQVAGG